MRDPNEIRYEIEASQVDLEAKLGDLKQLLESKLDVPRKVVTSAEHAIAFIRAHRIAVTIVVGFVCGALFARRHDAIR